MVNLAVQKPAENGLEQGIVRALGRRSIVLVGMMGAGKSSVGRRLAARLGIAFVDADTEIESAAGMTIAEIFDKHGEPDFRAGEARVIARLLDDGPQVLATGGGAVMDPATRDLIRVKGVSVWLKADLDVLVKRTKRRDDRPLADKMKDLLPAARAGLCAVRYRRAVARRAARRHRRRNHRRSGRSRSASPARRTSHDRAVACQRTDHRAGRAWRARLRDRHRPRATRDAGRAHQGAARRRQVRHRHRRERRARSPRGAARPRWTPPVSTSAPIVVAPGEGSKNYATFETVCEAIIAARIERSDLVVALGGGVIGDLAGFASASVRRGLDFVQVPTTLLAQVDSSVGGKTGIDSRQGKNLVGAFHQPILVVADTALLDTLPKREFRAGYAEMAKYGLLGDAAFFSWLEANWQDVFSGGSAARARHRGLLPRQGRHCGARRARNRRARAAQSRPHLRPRAGGRRRFIRPPAARRGGRARHGAGVRVLRPQGPDRRSRRRTGARASCGGRPGHLSQAMCPAACRVSMP